MTLITLIVLLVLVAIGLFLGRKVIHPNIQAIIIGLVGVVALFWVLDVTGLWTNPIGGHIK